MFDASQLIEAYANKSWIRSTIWNGGSLWSAGARDRFGSHLRIL